MILLKNNLKIAPIVYIQLHGSPEKKKLWKQQVFARYQVSGRAQFINHKILEQWADSMCYYGGG